jgi:DNA anti-recombination protein RmuC
LSKSDEPRYTAAEWREKRRAYREGKRIKEEQRWRRDNPHEAKRNDDQRSLNTLEGALHDLRREYAELVARSFAERERLLSEIEDLKRVAAAGCKHP